MRRAFAAVVVFAVACGREQPAGGPVATVSVTPPTATIAVGATQQFAATHKDASGNLTRWTVTWSTTSYGQRSERRKESRYATCPSLNVSKAGIPPRLVRRS